MRKIIQIATLPRDGTIPELIALCDDGTLWKTQILSGGYPAVWQQIQPLPPNPPAEPK